MSENILSQRNLALLPLLVGDLNTVHSGNQHTRRPQREVWRIKIFVVPSNSYLIIVAKVCCGSCRGPTYVSMLIKRDKNPIM